MNDRWMRGQLLPGTWFPVNPDFASQRHSTCQQATDVSTPSFESDATLPHAIGLTITAASSHPAHLFIIVISLNSTPSTIAKPALQSKDQPLACRSYRARPFFVTRALQVHRFS
jgi:hypothetical protein